MRLGTRIRLGLYSLERARAARVDDHDLDTLFTATIDQTFLNVVHRNALALDVTFLVDSSHAARTQEEYAVVHEAMSAKVEQSHVPVTEGGTKVRDLLLHVQIP